MAEYYRREQISAPPIQRGSNGVETFLNASGVLQNALNSVRDREIADQKMLNDYELKQDAINARREASQRYKDQEKRLRDKEAKDNRDLMLATQLLKVSPTEDVRGTVNQREIDAVNYGNAIREAKLEEYGNYFREANELNPQNRGESAQDYYNRLDTIARQKALMGSNVNEYGTLDVPVAQEGVVGRRNLPIQEYSRRLYEVLEGNEGVGPESVRTASELVKNYGTMTDKELERAKERKILEDYNALIGRQRPDINASTIEGGKAILDSITKAKEPKNIKGVGPQSQEAIYETGLVDSYGTDYADELTKELRTGKYNINDADLASLIRTANRGWIVPSSTQYDRILKMLEPFEVKGK